MKNLAKKLDDSILQETGTLVRKDGGEFIVRAAGMELRARRAVSCLVEPEAGDVVLLATNARSAWVLAVLERDGAGDATLVCEGDLRLQVPNGKVTIASQDGIELASAADVEVTAAAVKVNAIEGNVVVQRLTMFGDTLRAEIAKVKTIATTVDQTIERLSQRLKRSFKHVEEIDQIRAEQVDYEAKKLMALRAENAVIAADSLVKMDGEQIHVG